MIATIVIVFSFVYIGMILGGLPFLQLDRTGIAVLGAIALIASKSLTLDEAARALHIPTLILLFSFMVISAQLRLGGFYMLVTEKLGALRVSPAVFLAALIAVAAGLSSVFSNDVVCLATAPVLIDICLNRRLDPVPFLLALSCSSNIDSAATLIGNPQNMLIGETLNMSFADYLRDAAVPVGAGLVVTWLLIALLWRGRWEFDPHLAVVDRDPRLERHARFDPWQAAKGVAVAAGLFGAFLFSDWPREILALRGAGILLLSRKLHSTHMLSLVDWQIILLFIVNYALETTELPKQAVSVLAQFGFDLHDPELLYGASFLLSNVVSNVPAVMLLLPMATHPDSGLLLALSSTFAGNLLIVGSIANMIVVDAVARRKIVISWRRHAMVGVPVTVLTIAIGAAWYRLEMR